jgi:putative membrane protein
VIDSRGETITLAAIAALFAAFTVVTSLLPDLLTPGLIGIFTTIFLVAFALIHGATRYGVTGIVAFVVICLVVSNLFENVSILTGFPFGHYHYTAQLGPKIFLVPVTIGGAYFGAGYLSWTVAHVLLGRTNNRIDRFALWALPLAASILMTSWDFVLDPAASTLNHNWIWENGGGFFGVSLQNFCGWLLTVFVFFGIFAAYVRRRAGPVDRQTSFARGFWSLAVIMYALLGARDFLTYFASSPAKQILDATGHVWIVHDLRETAAIAAIFTVFAFSILAALRLADRGDQRAQP